MKSIVFVACLAALGQAQELAFGMIEAAPPVPTSEVPIGSVETTIGYDSQLATQVAAADISAAPVEVRDTSPTQGDPIALPKRRARAIRADPAPKVEKRTPGDCAVQPVGAGPIVTPDTPEGFLTWSPFSYRAVAALTPVGYTKVFTNLHASNNAYGYLGVTTLDEYNPQTCANHCNAVTGCQAINIYFERSPTKDPGDACLDPPSTTVIKCVFWGGPVTQGNAVNDGQWRRDFHVVIAGSNGYTNKRYEVPIPGYNGTNIGSAAINAPLDGCYNSDTYLGAKIFTHPPYDPFLCATTCRALTDYGLAHPPEDGSPPVTCQFFNTFLIMVNDNKVEGQYCAMYNETWSPAYATNTGQYRGKDLYTIKWSLAYSNISDPGVCQD